MADHTIIAPGNATARIKPINTTAKSLVKSTTPVAGPYSKKLHMIHASFPLRTFRVRKEGGRSHSFFILRLSFDGDVEDVERSRAMKQAGNRHLFKKILFRLQST